jgi:hypothetical protein
LEVDNIYAMWYIICLVMMTFNYLLNFFIQKTVGEFFN